MNEHHSTLQKILAISSAIGTDLMLEDMLKVSAEAYCKELECQEFCIYTPQVVGYQQWNVELLFAYIAGEDCGKDSYNGRDVLPEVLGKKGKQDFDNHLPLSVIHTDGVCNYVLSIGTFGYMLLVKEEGILSDEILESITSLNVSLANACKKCFDHKRLKISEKRYRNLGELLPEMICETDLKGMLTFVNKYALDKMGYSYADFFEGFNILRIFHPKEHERVMANFQESLKTDSVQSREYVVVDGQGKSLSVIVYTSRLFDNNKVVGLRGVMVDISERKQAELKLQHYAERLELALIGSNSGLWDFNFITKEEYYSNSWYRLLGYDPEDPEMRPPIWDKVIHPDDKERVKLELDRHLNGETDLFRTEQRMKTKSGEWLWILNTGKVTERTTDGKPMRAVGTNISIQERVESDEKLKKNLRQQELLSEIALKLNSIDGFDVRINSVLAEIGHFIQVSRVYIFEDYDNGTKTSNTYEWCNEGILSKKDKLQDIGYDNIPSWKAFMLNDGFARAYDISDLPEDVVQGFDYQGVHSIVSFPLYVKGELFGFVGFDECKTNKKWAPAEIEFLRTISGIISNAFERKIFEISLIESEKRNRLIIDSIPDILFRFDKEGKFLDYSASKESPLFLKPEQFMGRRVSELFPSQFSSMVNENIAKCLNGEKTEFGYYMEIAGEEQAFEAKMSKINDVEVLALIRNVSERKGYERKLEKERDRANQANKAKSEFLANMSHEIRTPMNAILGMSESLYHKLDSSKHKNMVQSVLKSGNLLMSLLNDILDLSKVEAGKLEISLHAVDLREIIYEINTLFTDKAEKKGVVFSYTIDDALPKMLMLDEIRLKQVVFNLVGNAVKFTKEGFVRIDVGFEDLGGGKGTVSIDVVDTGIGIAQVDVDRVFETFQQQSGQSSRDFGGVGLGLAISKRLVESMNGTISVTSELGVGSVFTVVLNDVGLVENNRVCEKKQRNVDEIVFSPSDILVVDDIASNILSIKSLLSDSHLSVMSAQSGASAIDICENNKPALVLMDIRMPGMDGFETANRLKALKDGGNLPIVAFTASVHNAKRIESSVEFDDVLYKPVNRAELFRVLARFLPHRIVQTNTAKEIESGLMLEFPLKTTLPLNEILDYLKENIYPMWLSVKDTLVIFKIEKFADELLKYSRKVKFDYLEEYAKNVKSDLDFFNLDDLGRRLSDFGKIIEQLEIEVAS